MRFPKVGDVVRSPSGLLRIVRAVSPSKQPHRYRVDFTIQHCSWTGRAVTTYSWAELKRQGYTLTRTKVPLKGKFDRLFAEDCGFPDKNAMNFTCCDVKGIP